MRKMFRKRMDASQPEGLFFLHCRQCLAEVPEGESPASYARISVGRSASGIHIRCMRHNTGIADLDVDWATAGLDFPEVCPCCAGKPAQHS